MNKIRVLHILDELNTGGADQIVYNYWKYIDKEKFHFDFVVMKIPEKPQGRLESNVVELGGNVYKVTKKQDNFIQHIIDVDNIIKQGNYDIVHSHLYELSAIYLMIAKKYGVPIRIGHSHSAGETRGWKVDLFRKILKPFLFCVANGRAACGFDAAYSLWGKKMGNKAYIMNNAIELDAFEFNEEYRKNVRNEYGVDDNTIVIGSIGRLSYEKNSEFLIDIFYEYKKFNNSSKLVLIGEGEKEKNVLDRIKKYNLQNEVILLKRRNDVYKLINAFDFFVLPSRYEGIPLVLVEAQCNGVKCVISNTITNQIVLSKNVLKKSINEEARNWAKYIYGIIPCSNNERAEAISTVRNAGYDIKIEVKKLENYYLGLLNIYCDKK